MLKAPGDHRYGKGWMIGKLSDGADAFSDGSIILRGKPPLSHPACIGPDFTRTEKKSVLKKMRLLQRPKRTKSGCWEVIIFSGGTSLQQKYYDEIRRRWPDAKFYAGRVLLSASYGERLIVAKASKQIVAIIAPCRL